MIVDREVELTAPAFDEAAWAEESWRAALDAGARLDELRAQLDRPPGERRAVQGLDGTLTALRDGLVSDVLIADPAMARRRRGSARAWPTPPPSGISWPGAASPIRSRTWPARRWRARPREPVRSCTSCEPAHRRAETRAVAVEPATCVAAAPARGRSEPATVRTFACRVVAAPAAALGQAARHGRVTQVTVDHV